MNRSNTMVFGSNARRSEKWRLFQICTANTTYHLEVQDPRDDDSRRCAVLTCLSPGSRLGQTFEDSSPRAGGKSLFGLTPLDWIGKQLEVGTVRTSEIVSVEFLSMADAPVSRKTSPVPGSSNATMTFGAAPSSAPAPRQEREAPRSWSAFPLGAVEMAEVAAALLNAVAHQGDVEAAVASQPLLKKRLSMALETCRLMLQTIDRAD
ncbi:MAG: hypothetical protein GQE15_07505 [Archangiaceae bacterium]|nr:hypothetical protein [Archangiaceae bacterium]